VNTSLTSRILKLLTDVAPDVDPNNVEPNLDFREQFDFDSMDTLHFAIALNNEFSIEIPEQDYKQLRNLAGCAAYVECAMTAKNRSSPA
jgi:acyl carrier protein